MRFIGFLSLSAMLLLSMLAARQRAQAAAVIALQREMDLVQATINMAMRLPGPGAIPIKRDGTVDLAQMERRLRLSSSLGLLATRDDDGTAVSVADCVADVSPLQGRSWELGDDYFVIDKLPASCMAQAHAFKTGNSSEEVESILGRFNVLNTTALKFKDLPSASVTQLSDVAANFTESIRTEATTPYTYYGCFTEGASTRALTGATYTDYTDMDVQTCANHCLTAGGFTLFGVEYGGECYCGNTLAAGAVRAFAPGCDMPCSGNDVQVCGGRGRLSLYGVSTTAPAVTFVPGVPAVTHYASLGCYTEVALADGGRALGGQSGWSPVMTTQECADFCRDSGQLLFGTEYGTECYCGSTLWGGSAPAAVGDCAMPCSGDAGEICGGPMRLSLYEWLV